MLQQLNFMCIFKWRGKRKKKKKKKNRKTLLGYVLFTSPDRKFKLLVPVQSSFLAIWCTDPGEALQPRTAVAAAMKPACLTHREA